MTTLDPIAVHLVETTASSGARYQPTAWASIVADVVTLHRLSLQMHLSVLAARQRLKQVQQAMRLTP